MHILYTILHMALGVVINLFSLSMLFKSNKTHIELNFVSFFRIVVAYIWESDLFLLFISPIL